MASEIVNFPTTIAKECRLKKQDKKGFLPEREVSLTLDLLQTKKVHIITLKIISETKEINEEKLSSVHLHP